MRHAKSKDAAAKKGSGSGPVIRSAARMLWVFHQLIRTPGGQQLSEISRGLGLPEVTVLRLLHTLVSEGFVRKDPERGRYRMSPMFWLAAVAGFPDVRDVQHQLMRALEGLAAYTSAAAMLAVPYVGLRSMGLAGWVPPPGVTMPALSPTLKVPMHATAGGKCYLAGLSEEALETWLRGDLPRVTEQTNVDVRSLTREIRQARARGYAIDREECLPGFGCLAVPLTETSGALVGALQVLAETPHIREPNIRRWLPRLQSTARSFSQAFSSLAQLAAP